jgi:uncharacterized membrane protein YdfJ with MMPL/SSD domain
MTSLTSHRRDHGASRVERILGSAAGAVARRRKLFLLAWLALVVLAVPLSAGQSGRLSGGGWEIPGSSSNRAGDALATFPGHRGEPLAILVEGRTPAAVDAAVERAQERIAGRGRLARGGAVQRLEGGRAAVIPLRYTGPAGGMIDFADELRADVVADAGGTNTRVVGEAAMWSNFQEVSQDQMAAAESIGFPLMLVILLAAFGTLLAAAMPLALGAVTVTITGAAIYLLAGSVELSLYVTNIATMVGLGVAVDYSLFVVASYRRRLAHGAAVPDAIHDAMASAGTAVVYSGATVIVSLAGLFLVDVNAIRSIAVGAIIVVSVAILATVGLLPALLALSGRRIERLRIGRRGRQDRESAFWTAWTRRVMSRPALFAALGTAVLLAMASPVLDIRVGSGGLEQLPRDSEVRAATERLGRLAGEGALAPIQVVTADRAVAERVAAGSRTIDGVAAVGAPVANRAGDRWLVEVVPSMQPESQAAHDVLDHVKALAGDDAAIGGTTSFNADMERAVFGGLWKILLFILALSYVVLLALLRSVLLPLKAVLMNTLSVGAAYGVLVAVFQWGWMDWTGYRSPGYVDSVIPVLLLAVVFGLSMDYEVFLLTRIRERRLAGAGNAEAVAGGLAASARTITAAALIMVTAFGAFALAGASTLKELGVGLAVAILVDATIVRLVLVPAVMRLLGEWNWWMPRRAARTRADETVAVHAG